MTSSSFEVSIDHDLCIGTGNCVYFAPEVFELEDGGQARVIDPKALPESEVIQAAEQCPIRAVRVLRDGVQVV
ncbi:MAG: ferredoxin [Mycobacteriales bacterium]